MIPARFLARPCLEVAPSLLGCTLLHDLPGGRRAGRIVEVEAYLGDGSDPASHSHRGRTARNGSMFGPPGRFYVYRSMGLHCCLNVVCEPEGIGAAVLVRALEPLRGIEAMRRSRRRPDRELANGPGKLTAALAIRLAHDGASVRGSLRLVAPRRPLRETVHSGPRIGITRARDLPYRFFLADNPWVSRSPLNRAASPVRRGHLPRAVSPTRAGRGA